MGAPTIISEAAGQRSSSAPAIESTWTPLYRIGAIAALASTVAIALAVAVFLVWAPPSDVPAFYALLRQNPLRGLLDLDLIMMITYAIMGPINLTIYAALRTVSQSLALIALIFELLGITLVIGSNAAFGMLSLSGQYAAATTEAQRTALIGAGQALMATSIGTGFNVGYVCGAVGGLLFAALMLKSHVFSKATGYMGLAMSALMVIPATVGTVGLMLSLISLAPTVVWLILVALRLLKFGHAPATIALPAR